MQMTPNQPYLVRAFYEWIVDNQLTPHIVVDATVKGVTVPQEHVKDGQIVLNVSPSACNKLQMGNVDILFEARFSGAVRQICVPCHALLAIYAKENGAGTVFTTEETADGGTTTEETLSSQNQPESTTDDNFLDLPLSMRKEHTTQKAKKKGKAHLKVIK
jgi:stringent starvation protein B